MANGVSTYVCTCVCVCVSSYRLRVYACLHVHGNMYVCVNIPWLYGKAMQKNTLFCCPPSHQSRCHFNLCATSGCIVVYFGWKNITIAQLWRDGFCLQHTYCFLTLYELRDLLLC